MESDVLRFNYEVPRELIAQEPLRHRADARLMVIDRADQSIDHFHFRDLPQMLRSTDRLVLNDTRVVPAQLRGHRQNSGGQWQGLFLGSTVEGHWRILCKARGRLQPAEAIELSDHENRPACKLWLLEKQEDGVWLAHPEPEEPAEALLARIGRVPLPPYIRDGQMVDADVENYQTVYARRPGAVAAPTAGLHFTKDLLQTLDRRGVGLSAVTLHVGHGTFRPITSPKVEDHPMHFEWGELTTEAAAEIQKTRDAGGRVIAVGTTVVRVLETAARQAPDRSDDSKLSAWSGETNLFVRPPFEFKVVDALLTNFHFPGTTLLLLVQAFAGEELIRRAYQEAIAEEYRFYSYGDAMLVV